MNPQDPAPASHNTVNVSEETTEKAALTTFQRLLGKKIGQLRDEMRGYLPLEKAIRKAFDQPEDRRSLLSRRQLQKIAELEAIPLRLDQLDLLDRFLRRSRHESLADMLNPPSVLRVMAEEGRIGFIIGSQPNLEARRIDFSRWDIKSMQVIQRALHATGKPVQILIEDVILRGKDDAEVFRNGACLPPSEDWYHLVGNLDSPGESLIVVGSPKVNHGAEVVLAAMLGVDPFSPWPSERRAQRPFAFFWPDWGLNLARPESCLLFEPVRDSRFVDLKEEDVQFLLGVAKRESSGQAELSRYDCAVVADGRVYPVQRSERERRSYAIIAARAGTHRTCACICGATGPSTLAAARVFERLVPELSWDRRDNRVAWCLVRADVQEDGEPGRPGFRADERRVVGQSIVDNKIHFYTPEQS